MTLKIRGIPGYRRASKESGRKVLVTPAAPDHQHPRLHEGTSMAEGQSSLPALPQQEGVEFRHIPGFPGYCVSDAGDVWTCRPRNGRGGLRSTWKPLAPLVGGSMGYLKVILRTGAGHHNAYIHRLVLEAFVGSSPIGQEARHLNGEHADNRLSNLCWGTSLENKEDMKSHGTSPKGERNAAAKLTAADVLSIREAVRQGSSCAEQSAKYGLSENHVRDIVKGRMWRHI